VAAKTDVYKDFQTDFSAATNFLSGLISKIHAGAQLDYSARNASKRRYVSAVGSHDGRGSRARARCGGGRYGQQIGRGGRGRGRGMKTYMNNVDCTDLHRNFPRNGNVSAACDHTCFDLVKVDAVFEGREPPAADKNKVNAMQAVLQQPLRQR
jgi:hypothetical protein